MGGLADLQRPGVVLVEPGDGAALRVALERLLGDVDARSGASAGARAEAADRFSASVVGGELVQTYERAVG